MLRKFNVKVDGIAYEVEVEEVFETSRGGLSVKEQPISSKSTVGIKPQSMPKKDVSATLKEIFNFDSTPADSDEMKFDNVMGAGTFSPGSQVAGTSFAPIVAPSGMKTASEGISETGMFGSDGGFGGADSSPAAAAPSAPAWSASDNAPAWAAQPATVQSATVQSATVQSATVQSATMQSMAATTSIPIVGGGVGDSGVEPKGAGTIGTPAWLAGDNAVGASWGAPSAPSAEPAPAAATVTATIAPPPAPASANTMPSAETFAMQYQKTYGSDAATASAKITETDTFHNHRMGNNSVLAPASGTIMSIPVREGNAVHCGDVLCVINTMGSENEILSPVDANVVGVFVRPGSVVNTNDILITLT